MKDQQGDFAELECAVWKESGATFLLGAQWWYAEDQGQAKELRSRLAKSGEIPKGSKTRCLRNADGSWLVSAWRGRANYLAAPLMAAVIRDGIFVHQIDEGRYWIMAAAGGCVLPGHDRVVSTDLKHQLLGEWYGALPDATLFGDESGAQMPAQDCWMSLIDGLGDSTIDKDLIKSTTLSRPLKASSVLLAVSALLVIGAVGLLLPTLLKGPAPADQGVNLALIDAARRAQEDAARQARLRARFDQAVEHLRQQNSQPAGVAEALQVIDLLARMSFERSGARMLSIECHRQDVQPDGATWSCAPTWRHDAAFGLLFQALLRADLPELGESSPGFVGIPVLIRTQRAPQSFVALHDSDWWLHQLHDHLLAAGVRFSTQEIAVGGDMPASGSVFALTSQEDLIVSASEFQENGYGLENVPDRHIGRLANAQWQTSLSQLADEKWRAFMSQWPMQVDHISINEQGLVVMSLRMARLDPVENP